MTRTQQKLAAKRYWKMALRLHQDMNELNLDHDTYGLVRNAFRALKEATERLSPTRQQQEQEAA